MALLSRFLALAGALALGASTVGCSHEHGPLADKPDTTSLGTGLRWGVAFVSTSDGLGSWPARPGTVIPGTWQGELSALTTQVQPPLTLLGPRELWIFGQNFQPRTGWALNSWTSGPNLPVEPWNMALEAPAEGGAQGHGARKAH
jgi:hypothetical protein